MAPPRRNVELKARDPDPARSLERCVALGAEDRGELRQRDTYFAARRGRLKLREQEPGGAELIAYERADAAHARESRYRIAPVAEPEALRDALDAALGTVVVVDKRRRLFLWEGVRIHLDSVDGLGARPTAPSTRPRTSRTPPTRRASAPRRRRSARWSRPARPRSPRSRSPPSGSRSARRAAA